MEHALEGPEQAYSKTGKSRRALQRVLNGVHPCNPA